MITSEVRGNLFDSHCDTLVCPVNTVGAMGKGLALEFKIRYPKLYTAYREWCFSDGFYQHGIFVYNVSPELKVLCIPTKKHFKDSSQLEWIDEALKVVARDYAWYDIHSIAMPQIGCGLGNLLWVDVYPLIKKYFNNHPVNVEVYLP